MTGPTGGFESKANIFLAILQGAAALLGNPALGVGGADKIAALVGFAAALVRGGARGADELKQVNEYLKQLVSEDRAPTDAEWATWEPRLATVDESAARRKAELDE